MTRSAERRGDRRWRHRLLAATLLAVTALAAGDCPGPDAPRLVNHTQETVDILVGKDGGVIAHSPVPGEDFRTDVGTFGPFTDCDEAVLIAETTDDGTEVDRRTGLCEGETWIIGGTDDGAAPTE